jgi:hypothetical protein
VRKIRAGQIIISELLESDFDLGQPGGILAECDDPFFVDFCWAATFHTKLFDGESLFLLFIYCPEHTSHTSEIEKGLSSSIIVFTEICHWNLSYIFMVGASPAAIMMKNCGCGDRMGQRTFFDQFYIPRQGH